MINEQTTMWIAITIIAIAVCTTVVLIVWKVLDNKRLQQQAEADGALKEAELRHKIMEYEHIERFRKVFDSKEKSAKDFQELNELSKNAHYTFKLNAQ